MAGISSIRRILRGEVTAGTAALESVRRMNAGLVRRRERRQLAQLNREPARLTPEFARMSHPDLLAHFRSRQSPKFLAGFADAATTAKLQRELFPEQTEALLADAARIANDHCWPLLGFGPKCFGEPEINWNRDPLSGIEWPLDYHGDINLFRGDGSDARVLWELNRLSHLITLGRAHAVSGDERLTTAFLHQIRSWRAQNPVARGANWACAMEVALRAMNLLAAFGLFLRSPQFDNDALAELLMMLDQHGAHIRRNLEYSHIATSNHYMCDVAGLLWLGIMVPELKDAHAWREFGRRELLNEMDKQILPDGADSESSTGYHRLKLELLLYSFLLCRENGFVLSLEDRLEHETERLVRLSPMANYLHSYLRPDGRAPLIGDSDSGQVLPIVKHAADDHAYVLALAAAFLEAPELKPQTAISEDLLWILGEQHLRRYDSLPAASQLKSRAFTDVGIYISRDDDLYLLFNASGCGLNGRGSHGHNDALSIELSAHGCSFIIDPGSYLYTHDLHERHLFRSTAYHSTVQVDGIEQNTTDEQAPFVIGNEADPRVLTWETTQDFDRVVAEHDGYRRLAQPVTHRRSVRFDKFNRFWLIDDEFAGTGVHMLSTRFHFNAGLETEHSSGESVVAHDQNNGARLLIKPLDVMQPAHFEEQFISRDYGSKERSMTACWMIEAVIPCRLRWLLLPMLAGEAAGERLLKIEPLVEQI